MAKKRKSTVEKSAKKPDRSSRSAINRSTHIRSPQLPGHDLETDVTASYVFPSWTPLVVSLLTLVFRVCHVTDPRNWWVFHPDEIFQSMEVAHSELFGYGLRPYEFNGPPKGDNLSHYAARELSLGMYALRSPLQAQYMVLAVWLVHSLGLNTSQPYLIFRVSHVVITSLLPLAVSKFTLATSRDPDVASLAAILTAASAYLNVMGSHTLVNSFVSPAIFLGLAAVVDLLKDTGDKSNSLIYSEIGAKESKSLETSASQSCVYNSVELKPCDTTFAQQRRNAVCVETKNASSNSSRRNNEKVTREMAVGEYEDENNNNRWCQLEPIMTFTYDENTTKTNLASEELLGNVTDDVFYNNEGQMSELSSGESGYDSMRTRSSNSSRSNNNSNSRNSSSNSSEATNIGCNRQATQLVKDLSIREELETSTALTNHSPDSATIETRSGDAAREQSGQTINLFKNSVSGFLLALAIYVRPDAAIFVTTILLAHYRHVTPVSLLHNPNTWFLILGAASGIVLGAADDIVFYQGLVLSPVNWCRFNVWNSLASQLFGVSEFWFYIHRVFLRDSGMVCASLVFALALLYVCYKSFWQIVNTCVATGDTEMRNEHNDTRNVIDSKTAKGHRSSEYIGVVHDHIYKHEDAVGSLRRDVVGAVLLTVLYSCIGHKEERFLHDVVVLFLVAVSETIVITSHLLLSGHSVEHWFKFFEMPRKVAKWKVHTLILISFAAVFSAVEFQTFHNTTKAGSKEWVFSSTASGQDTSLCLHFLSEQSDVRGVYIERNFQDTGGYSLLHKNVPLMYLIGQIFVEFTDSSLYKENRSCVVGEPYGHRDWTGSDGICKSDITCRREGSCNKGFYSITTVSDLFHKDNTQDLLRKITGLPTPASSLYPRGGEYQQPHRDTASGKRENLNLQQWQHQQHHHHPHHHGYNYAIVSAKKVFLSPAFRPVYRTPTMWLWRRVNKPDTEAWLRAVAGGYERKTETNHPETSASREGTRESDSGETTSANDTNKGRGHNAKPRPTSSRRETAAEKHVNKGSVKTCESCTSNTRSQCKQTHTSNSPSPDDPGRHNRSNVRDISTNSAGHTEPSHYGSRNTKNDKHETINRDKDVPVLQKSSTERTFAKPYKSSIESSKLNTDRLSGFLEYEAEVLKQMGNYWQALKRFETLTSISKGHGSLGKSPVKVSVLASAAFCLHRLGEQSKMQRVLRECMELYPRDQCMDGGRIRVLNLGEKT